MTNFIFKSANRLTKNSSINNSQLDRQLKYILEQNRHLRQDLVDVKLMLNKLLIDKHNQMQVDDFYENSPKGDSDGVSQ